MRRLPLSCLLVAGLLLLLAAGPPAGAMSIVDLDTTDLNSITGQAEDDQLNELVISEDYNETFRIPYPSHDGYAIVNPRGGFFDKVVTFTEDDLDGPWVLDFRVLNTSPYCWSDYHFSFWTEDFAEPLLDFPLENWGNNLFLSNSFDGQEVQFWAPGSQCPGQTNQYLLRIDPRLINNGLPGSFGVRQIATTVPEPLTMLGLGLSVCGVGSYLRRRVSRET